MGDTPRHRVWAFSVLAWAALVVVPTAFISISWMLGIITDSSVPTVFDLFPFALIFAPFAAVVVFGLLVPFALAADLGVRGRTTRAMNLALGAALGITAFGLFFAGSAVLQLPTPFTPRRMIADGVSLDTLSRVLATPQTAVVLAMCVVSGMLVGLGLRHRAAVPSRS